MSQFRLSSATISILLAVAGASHAWALATEEFGNKELAEANYKDWKGIMPVINHKDRVYSYWVNGNESFFYLGKAKELNAALKEFAKVEVKYHVVVLRYGPTSQETFQKTVIPYNWQLHVVGGIAKAVKAVDDVKDLDWQTDPVLTIYVGDGLDLKSLEMPAGVTLAVRKEDANQKGQQELIDYVQKWNAKKKEK
jgi:hypothetical protein